MSKVYVLSESALEKIGYLVADMLGGGVSGAAEFVVETIKELALEHEEDGQSS